MLCIKIYIYNDTQDENAKRLDGEILNGFQEYKLTMDPGNCSHYVFNINEYQKYINIHPAPNSEDRNVGNCHFGKQGALTVKVRQ